MKKILLFVSFFSINVNLILASGIIYNDPKPNAEYVKINNTIVLGFTSPVINFPESAFTVKGSKSGLHTGIITLSNDKTKLIFIPHAPYHYNEMVTVNISSGIRLKDNSAPAALSYSFTTQLKELPPGAFKGPVPEYNIDRPSVFTQSKTPGLPEITVNISNNPSPGKIFMSNFPFTPQDYTPYLLIVENTGEIYTYIGLNGISLDFKKQPNGNLTYFDEHGSKFYELDISYRKVDSFYCGNGYPTDGHELRVLPNRHGVLMCYDTQSVDMSKLVAGGDPNAIVIGLIIQEIDENKNVVFQWRSWDHIPIMEAQHQNMTLSYVDYIHGNAIEIDNDGHYMISSRHLDEITKIDKNTGNIIWRLGGPQNDFQFINDPDGKFYYQHGIRRLANGNIILYDNGNFHTPPHSRAVEYTLDEVNMTATMVWQYRNTPERFGFAMGFAQRLENGNTLISWGSTNPTLTEVTPSGEIALEMTLPPGYYSYRTFKDSWDGSSVGMDPPPLYYIPAVYDLRQNYPNPFNPVTTIEVDIPSTTYVTLGIYDVLGRLVRLVANGELDARRHVFTLNASDFSSGVYFYTLRAGDYVQTKRMVVVK